MMGNKWVKDGQKKAALGLRLYELDLKALELMAGAAGLTVSEMARLAIREAAQARGIMPTAEESRREGVIV